MDARRTWLALVAGALASASVTAAGCKRTKYESPVPAAAPTVKPLTLDDVIAQYRPKVEPKITSALRIGASLPRPTGRDAIKPERGPIHVLVARTGTLADPDGGAVPTNANATVLHAEDLKGDLTTETDLKYGVGERLLLDCAAILHRKTPVSDFSPAKDPKQTARVLEQCGKFVYLLVVRTQTKAEPQVNQTARTFTAGHVEGDVLVFELDGGKNVGDYRFSAKNSSHVDLSVSDPWSGLEKEVRGNEWSSIRDGFQKYAPGSTVESAY
jgi:hypothetical protein